MKNASDATGNHARRYSLAIGGLLLLLIGIDRVAPLLLPPSVFHYRPWEYMMGSFGLPRSNHSITMDAYGDLGNMLGVSHYFDRRRITFSLDENGHRNPPALRVEAADILLVGNSFVAGAGNDDADILAARLHRLTGLQVRTYAPADISRLLADAQFVLPPIVMWGRVERNLTSGDALMHALSVQERCEGDLLSTQRRINALKPAVKRMVGPPVSYARLSLVRRTAQRLYRSTRFALGDVHDANVVIGNAPMPMLFFARDVRLLGQDADARGMDDVVEAIAFVDGCLRQRDTTLVMVPIPDKSNMYRAWVPAAPEPLSENPLDVLAENVRHRGIPVIPLRAAFQEAAADTEHLLYWRDDTHWNPAGIDVAAREIATWLKNADLLPAD